MKFMAITDTQIRGNTPSSRNGDFVKDMLVKFEEVVKVGNEMRVDYFIHAGDVFDRPLVSLGVADQFVDIMESSGKEWLIIRGNHDEIGHNPNHSGESMLDHVFRRSKLIRHLGGRCVDEGRTYIEGFDYYHGIEADIKEKGLMAKLGQIQRKIAVVHALIVPEKLHPAMMHVVCDEVKSDFDLVIVGHYHREFGTRKVGDTTYIGIGALARMTISKWDAERVPNMLFIDTTTPRMRIMPLEKARPSAEVFDMSVTKEEEVTEYCVDDFIDLITDAKFQGLNLRGVVEEVAKSEGIDRQTTDAVIAKIGEYENV